MTRGNAAEARGREPARRYPGRARDACARRSARRGRGGQRAFVIFRSSRTTRPDGSAMSRTMTRDDPRSEEKWKRDAGSHFFESSTVAPVSTPLFVAATRVPPAWRVAPVVRRCHMRRILPGRSPALSSRALAGIARSPPRAPLARSRLAVASSRSFRASPRSRWGSPPGCTARRVSTIGFTRLSTGTASRPGGLVAGLAVDRLGTRSATLVRCSTRTRSSSTHEPQTRRCPRGATTRGGDRPDRTSCRALPPHFSADARPRDAQASTPAESRPASSDEEGRRRGISSAPGSAPTIPPSAACDLGPTSPVR